MLFIVGFIFKMYCCSTFLTRIRHVRQFYNSSSVNNLKLLTEKYNKNVDSLKSRLNSIQLPERFKGTIVEKWSLYWKELYTDYYEVARETVTNARNNPRKAVIYFICFGFVVYLNKSNPAETSFRDALLTASNDIMLVGKEVRNPISDNHLTFVESCYNAGLVRNFSFGIFSVMWIDDYDSAVGLYKANCTYLQPQYLTLYQRVIDVGFLNKWWFIENKMKDYDINPNEWSTS